MRVERRRVDHVAARILEQAAAQVEVAERPSLFVARTGLGEPFGESRAALHRPDERRLVDEQQVVHQIARGLGDARRRIGARLGGEQPRFPAGARDQVGHAASDARAPAARRRRCTASDSPSRSNSPSTDVSARRRIGELRLALVGRHHRHVAHVLGAAVIAGDPPAAPSLLERAAVDRREAVRRTRSRRAAGTRSGRSGRARPASPTTDGRPDSRCCARSAATATPSARARRR